MNGLRTIRLLAAVMLISGLAVTVLSAKGRPNPPGPPDETPARLSFENLPNHRITGSPGSYDIDLADGHPTSEVRPGLISVDFSAPSPGTGVDPQETVCGTDPFVGASRDIEVYLSSIVLTDRGGRQDTLRGGLFGMDELEETNAIVYLSWWMPDRASWDEHWRLRLNGQDGSALAKVKRLADADCVAVLGLTSPCWHYELSGSDQARLLCFPSDRKGRLDVKNQVLHSLYSLPTRFFIEAIP